MKLSSQEEYGLRCLMRLALQEHGGSLTIPQIGQVEGISHHNVAKYLSVLRRGGFVVSARGQHGGYSLARAPEQIRMDEVLDTLGDRLYDPGFCAHHTGVEETCRHTAPACSLRDLWIRLQEAVDGVLARTRLQDLMDSTAHPEAARDGAPLAQPQQDLVQISSSP